MSEREISLNDLEKLDAARAKFDAKLKALEDNEPEIEKTPIMEEKNEEPESEPLSEKTEESIEIGKEEKQESSSISP